MNSQDSDKLWDEYYQRKKLQRIEEANILIKQISNLGIKEETVFALDFVHFAKSEADARSLAQQLSESYSIDVATGEDGVWYINGTSRPYGITLSPTQHLKWVEFMADVAQSHACVFSTWNLEVRSLNLKFSSESIDVDS